MSPPSSAPPLSLTLILAATPSLGIGKAGTLPWPQLRKEMGYFKRVTMRVPPRTDAPERENGRKRVNTVVMGRKTWDSIPERFRPLEGRLNVVVTRKPEAFPSAKKKGAVEGPIVVGSVTEAVERLQALNAQAVNADGEGEEDRQGQPEVERVFVIGGATIYDAALKLSQTDRVLLTKIENEFECDTFFSVELDKDETWKRSSREGLEEFTGEKVEAVEEKGVRFEFGMYERVKGKGR
ncbi:hypothetical protein BU23DRAFT_143762 [Bimuria novae-zelandiae CBS 107.79]|uniref:Dihydrofolate reductase n=1 Tax=Bimuria novae-zelandiae CBS 107.79 TaxID=1447943 RepID=A0A6A5VHN9_9PLEO|nr:hypothetical protein BU23DRAFT_143762 [Bimuria novae-zelandiae CBS 107.79]